MFIIKAIWKVLVRSWSEICLKMVTFRIASLDRSVCVVSMSLIPIFLIIILWKFKTWLKKRKLSFSSQRNILKCSFIFKHRKKLVFFKFWHILRFWHLSNAFHLWLGRGSSAKMTTRSQSSYIRSGCFYSSCEDCFRVDLPRMYSITIKT